MRADGLEECGLEGGFGVGVAVIGAKTVVNDRGVRGKPNALIRGLTVVLLLLLLRPPWRRVMRWLVVLSEAKRPR